MNVDDVMSLPKNRKPSAIDAVSLMLLRDKAYRDVVSEGFAALIAPLDQTRQAVTMALPSVADIMRAAYDQACREAGGIGTVHAVETAGGRVAVRDLVTALLQ
jgi:hypothetical protein